MSVLLRLKVGAWLMVDSIFLYGSTVDFAVGRTTDFAGDTLCFMSAFVADKFGLDAPCSMAVFDVDDYVWGTLCSMVASDVGT